MEALDGARQGSAQSMVQLRMQATDVLRSLVRRSQRSSGSWSPADRQQLSELSASLHDNLELLPLRDDAPASAVTRARARAVVELVADIGALCRGRTDFLDAAEETTARLPKPPPLHFGSRPSVPSGTLPPAHASPASRTAFEDRAQSLIQIAARHGWPDDEEERLQALVASMCETARMLVHSRSPDGRSPPGAVAGARGRAIEAMLDEIAELFQRRSGNSDRSQQTRTVGFLRSHARKFVTGEDRQSAPNRFDGQNGSDTAKGLVLTSSHSPIVDTSFERDKIPRKQDATAQAALRRMSRRHELAVLRAWRRHVATLLDVRRAATYSLPSNVHADTQDHTEESRGEHAALMQQLRVLESSNSLARMRAVPSNAETLAEAESAVELSLERAHAETKAANDARASALASLAEAEERAEQAQRKIAELQHANAEVGANEVASAAAVKSSVETEMNTKVRELESQLNDERVAGTAKCEHLEDSIAELQRQLDELQTKSREEAISAGKAAKELAAKAMAAEDRALAAEQLSTQQSEECRRKAAMELSAQQSSLQWQKQAESANRDLEKQCAHTHEAQAIAEEERIRRVAAEQSLADIQAQFDRIAHTVRQAEAAAYQLADAKHAVILSANDLKDEVATSRAAVKDSGLSTTLQEHLQSEQAKVHTLESQNAELLTSNHDLATEIRELKLQGQQQLQAQSEAAAAGDCASEVQTQAEQIGALERQNVELLSANQALIAEMQELKQQAQSEAAAAAECTRELRTQVEHIEALENHVSELEQEARETDGRAQLAQAEADKMVERIASLAEMKIQEAERQVQLARERARVKVEEAERLVLAISEEVEQLSAQDLTLGDRDLE